MIFRRCGERLHSVRPSFDARAVTGIGYDVEPPLRVGVYRRTGGR